MTRKELSVYRAAARGAFDGSDDFFRVCWRRYLRYQRCVINSPTSQDNVDDWLDVIAKRAGQRLHDALLHRTA